MAKFTMLADGIYVDNIKILDFAEVVQADKDVEFKKTVTVDEDFTAKGHRVIIITDNSTDDDDVNYEIVSVDNKLSIRDKTNDVTLLETDKDGKVTVKGNTVWHEGNDGDGSGLDADKVDGIEAANFARSDEDDEINGVLTHKARVKVEHDKATVALKDTTNGTKVLAVQVVGDTLKMLNETDNIEIVLFNSDGTAEYKGNVTFDNKVTVNGDITTTAAASLDGTTMMMPNLPTDDPGVENQLWNDGGIVKVSAGS